MSDSPVAAPPPAPEPLFAIDVFSVYRGRLHLQGWLIGTDPARKLTLRAPGLSQGEVLLRSYGRMASPDVAAVHGPAASHVRFDETLPITGDFVPADAELVVSGADAAPLVIRDLGAPRHQRAPLLTSAFAQMLRQTPPGRLLEVGSRARSGITRRDLAPADWHYTGLDIVAGPNVDRVGDAHELDCIFPEERFDAVMAFSVLEHLLMPWKFAIALNAVLNIGAIGCFTTHQCWPLHDAPWDFWRFSDGAWAGILNRATGFEIIETGMGEPAVVVAQRCHSVTNFGESQHGYLASNVLFRKIGPTNLTWPVSVAEVTASSYPGGEVAPP